MEGDSEGRAQEMSLRAIGRELGINRATVRNYLDAEGPRSGYPRQVPLFDHLKPRQPNRVTYLSATSPEQRHRLHRYLGHVDPGPGPRRVRAGCSPTDTVPFYVASTTRAALEIQSGFTVIPYSNCSSVSTASFGSLALNQALVVNSLIIR